LEKGYIKRTGSETDKRKVIISITEKGKDIILKVLSERDEWLNEALRKTCTEEEKELIKKALAPLTKLVDFD
jgi:DNA-binding MarR family transcriptional regulator